MNILNHILEEILKTKYEIDKTDAETIMNEMESNIEKLTEDQLKKYFKAFVYDYILKDWCTNTAKLLSIITNPK